MLSLGTVVILVAGIVALMVVILARRGVHVDELGSVIDDWLQAERELRDSARLHVA